MKITLQEVRRIAHLANLRFDDAGLERFRVHLDQILGYIDKLGQVDTSHVEPAAGGGTAGRLREDEPLPPLSADEALANAPESGRGHFKVPRVMA